MNTSMHGTAAVERPRGAVFKKAQGYAGQHARTAAPNALPGGFCSNASSSCLPFRPHTPLQAEAPGHRGLPARILLPYGQGSQVDLALPEAMSAWSWELLSQGALHGEAGMCKADRGACFSAICLFPFISSR
ncbi:hypothetical protein [Paracoccus sp. (in: a-proteobacteria)]|uniref:hypothetical protein n=1 Tax=Paracoccus sp. TaxID=267 RepID=UPI0026E056B4|nr:hypothetical protein [Paracoccus sp. (in: a-proteobacteria)]MDO5369820.1 hypothetical protein [Paracoccus sp. (in: a-proteobacteria)]